MHWWSIQFDGLRPPHRNAAGIVTLFWVARNEVRFSRTDSGALTKFGVSQFFRSSKAELYKLLGEEIP